MAGSISMKKKTVKESTSKPNIKPLPGDKQLGIDPAIRFYERNDSDKTEQKEEV